MGNRNTRYLHRRRRHDHALERLRERYDANATIEDVRRLAAAARAAILDGKGGSRPGYDGISVWVQDEVFGLVGVIYVTRHAAIATVMPRGGHAPAAVR